MHFLMAYFVYFTGYARKYYRNHRDFYSAQGKLSYLRQLIDRCSVKTKLIGRQGQVRFKVEIRGEARGVLFVMCLLPFYESSLHC